MDDLKIQSCKTTPVNQVVEKLIAYFKEQGFQTGSAVPDEMGHAVVLRVVRLVLLELEEVVKFGTVFGNNQYALLGEYHLYDEI